MFSDKERIINVAIEEEMKNSYIDYSMSVIVGRALPDVRDGLKPVHRRILYAMYREGLLSNRKYSKCAGVVGECLKKYHPHGDTAVYDSLVRMAQPWNLRYPLIDGQGNFGSVDGDSAAAYRYTEARMKKIAEEMLADIDKNTVNFAANFDETTTEPVVLPSRVPNLLVNGSSGIAVGMATNIPPHNLGEVVNGLIHLIDNPDATAADLMQHIQGPDFPTGGIIYGQSGIKSMYEKGRGLIKLRGRAFTEISKSGRESLVVSEIPYTVNKASLIEKIAELVSDKRINGISDIRDESDKEGMRIVIDLKRNEVPEVILNQLYKHTQLQITFGAILIALDHGQPRVMTLKEILSKYIEHRREVVIRRTQFELDKAEARAHILEGFKIALDNLDDVVKIIRDSENRQEAHNRLMAKFGFSTIQANAILDMRLYQLTGLERDKVEEEYRELLKLIEYLRSILESHQKVLDIIKEELKEVTTGYNDNRRTDIVHSDTELTMEDLIADEACVITVTHTGYIRRGGLDQYRSQKRGGKGIVGMNMKDEDYVEHLFSASTHDYILIFTKDGDIHWLKVYEIPESGRATKGKAIVNLLGIAPDSGIAALVRVKAFDDQHNLIMATRKGIIKKTNLEAYSRPRKGGIRAINIDEGDELISVHITSGADDIILATRNGMSIRFDEDENIRETGRVTRGVKGIRLGPDDEVVGMEIVDDDAMLLVVTENGYGKRTRFDQYRAQGRGGKGVITIKANERNGKVVGIMRVTDEDEIMLISIQGKTIRMKIKDLSIIGRNTQGVRMINLQEDDQLVALTRVFSNEDQEGDVEGESDEDVIPEDFV
ncbi:MAG: DNA gyrase subunit A [Candidatus Auribacter fodinae]|jgi:DNA gyrase subunit A|uniref:DNA gyrase subunit A n=1 Tax=Candidatus Auribacter fodinae TaxID=2093366 RepID=A0A3A4RHD0_9BACT|nr:MAG: DNA gyrase subunit A [Candidatus Auribacter fodinae]